MKQSNHRQSNQQISPAASETTEKYETNRTSSAGKSDDATRSDIENEEKCDHSPAIVNEAVDAHADGDETKPSEHSSPTSARITIDLVDTFASCSNSQLEPEHGAMDERHLGGEKGDSPPKFKVRSDIFSSKSPPPSPLFNPHIHDDKAQ